MANNTFYMSMTFDLKYEIPSDKDKKKEGKPISPKVPLK